MPGKRAARLVGLLLSAACPAVSAARADVVVYDVSPHEEADRAGVRVGDRLLSWRTVDGGTEAMPAAGELIDPLRLERLVVEHGSRAPVRLALERGGERLDLLVEPGTWGVAARPDLPASELERFEWGWAGVRSEPEEAARAGLAAWAELARSWRGSAPAWSLWLELVRASAATRRNQLPEAEAAAGEARRLAASAGDHRAVALAVERLGRARERASRFDAAREAFEEGVELLLATDPGSLTLARAHEHVGRIAWWQDRLDDAQRAHERALAIRAAIAPEGLPVADSLNDLGLVAWNRGDLETCEGLHRRALAIRRREAPRGLKTAYSLVNLGIVTWKRGALAEAERAYQEALASYERLRPDSVELARALENLAIVRMDRGRVVEAEALFQRSLDLFHRWGTQRDVAHALTNLGSLALHRGDALAAAAYAKQAIEIKESLGLGVDSVSTLEVLADLAADPAERRRWLVRIREILEAGAPDSFQLPKALVDLGEIARAEGKASEAAALLAAGLERAERAAPGSWLVAEVLGRVALFDLEDGRQEVAEARLRRALELVLADLPGTAEEARTRYLLARALRARGAVPEALELLALAETILETNLADREGTVEERARYRASWADLYHEHVALLVESGRAERAFAVVERYRARELAGLLAARDLEFAEVPEPLARRHQMAQASYRRLLSARRAEPGAVSTAAREELLAARRELSAAADELARVAPRTAALGVPPALDLEAARASLEPGTALLSYVVGADRSWLLALGPGERELAILPVAAGRDELAARVRELRGELSAPSLSAGWRLRARALGTLLLAPVADRIAAAERVLVLPDGPLHHLPFAALPLPGRSPEPLLVELRPLQLAASLSVLAGQSRAPARERPRRVVAFADPAYREAAASPRPPALAGAVERGLDLTRLPESRREAERIRDHFPSVTTLWLGEHATEERAKSVGPEVSNLHFACHALVDPRSPLDSALALASPAGVAGEDGLLQAWEILEQVRLDADLVVLSACETALGENLPGEGVLGLVRAFQLAGARGVIATQWKVSDRAASDLSEALYRRLRAGADAAQALRAAQLALARRPATAHPYFWAAFELFGAAR